MKKLYLLLVFALFLCGCSGKMVPTQPTDEITTVPIATVPATTVSTAPTAAPVNPEWEGCAVIKPEEGVLILHENESFQDTIIEGDVYITANAEVKFDHVWVRGDLYVHGKLIYTRRNQVLGIIYTYKYGDTLCSAYDGIHGEIMADGSASFSHRSSITVDALDYAFENWGKVELTEMPPTEVCAGGASPSGKDPTQVRILSGTQKLINETIRGDVYILPDGEITFINVLILGNVYVAGKLHLYDAGSQYDSKIDGYLYAYDFGVTCEVFDGTHGQITGGPVFCKGYVVANDALDYAFETWGKQ